MAEMESLRCEHCGGIFLANRHYYSHGSTHERKYCDQQCRTDAKLSELIPVEEIARRAKIIRELRESGNEIVPSKLDWFQEPEKGEANDVTSAFSGNTF